MAAAIARLGAEPLRGATLAAGLAVALGVLCGLVAVAVSPLYAIAGGAAVVAGLIVASNVRLALLALLGVFTLLPYAVLPVSIGGIKPTLVDALLILLLATAGLRLLTRRDEWRPSLPADLPLALFLGVSVAAFVLGTAYRMTPELIRQYLKLMNSTLFFFVITQLIRSRADLELTVRGLIGGGALAAGIGVALYHLSADTASQLLRALRPVGYPTGQVLRYVEDAGVRTETLRAIGTSVDPNIFGALLLIAGGLAIGQLLAAHGRARVWLSAAVALIVYALLLSLSRGAWVGLAAAVAVLVAIRYRRAAVGLALGAVVVGLTFAAQLSGFVNHFLKAVYARDQATGMRLGEFKDAVNLIQQHPWLGIGFGGAPSSDLYLGVSSTYLLVAEEMGLVGLALFLTILVVTLRYGIRAYQSANEASRPLLLACLATLAGVMVAALFDRHFFDLRFQHMTAMFWLVVALALLSGRLPAADNRS